MREEVSETARFGLGRLDRWWKFTKIRKQKGETHFRGNKTARAVFQTS